jgi:hypothetical protein
MKRIKSFNDFIDSNVNEGIFSKIARSFTGADRKEINAQVKLLRDIYEGLNDEEKKEFSDRLQQKIDKNNQGGSNIAIRLREKFKTILDSGDWYSELGEISSDDAEYLIMYISSLYQYIIREYDNIKEVVQKNKLTKELEKYNEDVAKYNKISSFIKNDFESKKEEFNKFFSCIDGSPNFKNRDTYAFIDKFNASDGNKKILETDIFKRFKAYTIELNHKLKSFEWNSGEFVNTVELYDKVQSRYEELFNKSRGMSIIPDKPNFQISGWGMDLLTWAEENLKDKTISEMALDMTMNNLDYVNGMDYVEIGTEDTKVAIKSEDGLIGGNIVYSGQNFNNLNLENVSYLINKEGGYRERVSGKVMYVTNNIPYAFYYCYLRFGLDADRPIPNLSQNLFPTVYKITLKKGTKFFHKSDSDIDQREYKLASICGMSGYHSGNETVNGQSVEITLINSDCIDKIEAIKPGELISYFESPEFTKDNQLIKGENYKIDQGEINWYKGLVSRYVI